MRGLEFIGALGIFGEPAFFYPFFLLENLFDGPKGGKSKDAQQGSYQYVVHAEGTYDACNAQQKEKPPAPCAPMVFCLDDYGVEDADDEKGADADDQAGQMVRVQKIHKGC